MGSASGTMLEPAGAGSNGGTCATPSASLTLWKGGGVESVGLPSAPTERRCPVPMTPTHSKAGWGTLASPPEPPSALLPAALLPVPPASLLAPLAPAVSGLPAPFTPLLAPAEPPTFVPPGPAGSSPQAPTHRN